MAFDNFKKVVTQVLQLDYIGSIVFGNGSVQTIAFRGNYGAFSDYTTQTISSTTTAYKIAIGQTDEAVGVACSAGRMTVAETGVYNFQWSGQFANTGVADGDAYVWLRKNGTDIIGSTGLISIPAKHGSVAGHSIYGWNFVMSLTAGDYLELWWSAETTSVTIDTYAVGSTPTRPSTASVVATLTQVR